MCGTGYRPLPLSLSLPKLHCLGDQGGKRGLGYRLRKALPGQLRFWLPQFCVPSPHSSPAKLADSLGNCPFAREVA
eukprot:3320312-Amphidinium_carterae.1